MNAKKSDKTPASDAGTTENGAAPSGEAAQAETPPLVINGQYIKDLSFEVPGSPGIFSTLQKDKPDISVNVDVKVIPMQEKLFEVILHMKAECKSGDTVAFILELAYAGLFTVNSPPEYLQPILLIECPRLLFPFARYIITDVTRDGGFPPLMLSPVDFAGMYRNQVEQQGKDKTKAAPEGD